MKPNNSTALLPQLIKSGLLGACLAVLVLLVLGLALYQGGVLEITLKAASPLKWLVNWAIANIGYAMAPFLVFLGLYWHTLGKLKASLEQPDVARVMHLENQLDIWTSLFFGVGVIWTTIGLRSALIAALDGLTADKAAAIGAFGLLERLVDGGILLALSTTIIGGLGGYGMRMGKSLYLGGQLRRYYYQQQMRFFDPLIDELRQAQQLPARVVDKVAEV